MDALFLAAVVAVCVSGALAADCDNSTFPVNLNNVQVLNLQQAKGAGSVDDCLKACCAMDGCTIWQFAAQGPAQPLNSCWIGKSDGSQRHSQDGWISRGRGIPPPPPPPPSGPYNIDDTHGLGLRWEGVGAISGGGATTKLLMDFDPAVASDILDYLFKPNFGLSLQILKVELGGDADATEGAEPSHMHFKGDLNYERGYEWWLMKEAKSRNPDIKLYGLPWAFPGWLDPDATPDKAAKNAFANPNVTANYTLAWLLGAKDVHNLNIDYIGQWNERDAPSDYAAALRRVVADKSPLTFVLNRLPHYPGTDIHPDPQGCTQYAWNTTDGSRWVDEEGSVADGQSARCLSRCVSRNYITGCHTATFQWHLVSSFYDYLPWKRCGVAVANRPWDQSYEITSPTWALAHTTQFAPIGWRYASHAGGVGLLSKGGSYVTRISPDKKDISIVVEKMTHDDSACARGSNPPYDTAAEDVVFNLKGSFADIKSLHVWYSNLTSPSGAINPPDEQLFLKKDDVEVKNGQVTIRVLPNELYTLTTLSTGNKGKHTSPAPKAFPLPYKQDFDKETVNAPPYMWYDQMGAWQINPRQGGSGNVMRQMSTVWPACWGYSCTAATTYFGPEIFNTSTRYSVDVMAEDHVGFTFGVSNGVTATVATNGTWNVGKSSGKGISFDVNTWHTLSLEVHAKNATLSWDGKVLGVDTATSTSDGSFIKVLLDRYVFANMDNFVIEAI